MTRLPPSASVAHASTGEMLFAPSAERNKDALVALLRDHAPRTGEVLEIASGTGQHITAFAAAFPALHWHPSERDPARRASINAYVAQAGLANVSRAIALDISAPSWGEAVAGKDLITCANLSHLITQDATRQLIQGAASALRPGGRFILYGPFKRSGVLTSAGDARFDAELREADAGIGYKDDLDIWRWLGDAGMRAIDTVPMPANNLSIIAQRPAL